MKITVIGGGSTYTPELINGFLSMAEHMPLKEIWLEDIDPHRLEVVGGFAQRMAAARGDPFRVILSTNQRDSIAGASYVITQLRVGMMPARREDEYLGLRHGLVGQETTGIGGMAKALRTIPVILDIANDIRKTAPGAVLVNFTNPAGLVTEALTRYAPDIASVGVCNVGVHTKMEMLEQAEKMLGEKINPDRAGLLTLGLNHLTWHYGFTIDGEDIWPQILNHYLSTLREEKDPEWDPRLIEIFGMIPNSYLQYFYETDHKIKSQAKWPPSRAEQVMQIEKSLLQDYANPHLVTPPADLMKRGGAFYSTLATQLIESHHNHLGQVHVVNIRHAGAVPGWPVDWVLELPARVDRQGFHPLPARPLPPVCFGLITQVKMYELLTVEAAVHGDRKAAFEALLANPLGPQAGKAQAVLDDMLETNRPYLPLF